MNYIKYGKKELDFLSKRDIKIKSLIEKYGFIKRETNSDLFSSLISSIISQQISTKAAASIYSRLIETIKILTPETINTSSVEALRSCGLSERKVTYIKDIAKSFVENHDLYKELHLKTENEIIEILTKLEGVGMWTAQMMLIHTFERKDIISFGDLGIKKGLMYIYDLKELTKEDELYFKNLFTPYGTIASIYIWNHYAFVNK